MNEKLTLFAVTFFFALLFQTPVTKASTQLVEKNTGSEVIVPKKLDPQAQILSDYLAKFDSPLENNAQDFIDAARQFNLDWKMLPAIAGVESTFGKRIPGGFNAWGWGVYGNQAIFFNSWKEGIFIIAKGLRENYLNKGLSDPYSINRIYAASPYWGGKVTYFMEDLEKFAQDYQVEKDLSLSHKPPKTAADSAELALSNFNKI